MYDFVRFCTILNYDTVLSDVRSTDSWIATQDCIYLALKTLNVNILIS